MNLATQVQHYADVRARLWRAPPVLVIVVETPQEPVVAPPDDRPMWTTPILMEVADSEEMRVAMVMDFLQRAPHVTARLIAHTVSQAFGISRAEIYGDSRRLRYVRPRQIAMAIAYRQLSGRVNGTMPAIGRVFGGRDHTTVLHAVRKYGAMVECAVGRAGTP